ncbi:reverse transcriptase domain-containing protein [Tanacetum coccineum]
MEIFIKEFRTTNELLLKERSNLLSKLKIEVNELSRVIGNVLIPKNKVKGVTTRGGKMTSKATAGKEINETGINKNEPPRFGHDVQEKPHDVGVKNKSSSIIERTTQPLVDKSVLPIDFVILDMLEDFRILIILGRPFLATAHVMIDVFNKKITRRVEDDEVIFDMDLEKSINQSDLKSYNPIGDDANEIDEKKPELAKIFEDEKISLLQVLEKRHCEISGDEKNTLMQVLEKRKEAEDLAIGHLSRLVSPHIEVLTDMEVADELPNEHLMLLKCKFKDDEPWYVNFVKSIVGKIEHKAHWADLTLASKSHLMQHNELAELRDGAYKNIRIYKEQDKKWHDSRLRGDKYFKVGDKVLLYNSHLKMYPRKLKSK